ncbi:MAG: hypothetical protein ACRDF0_03020 [Candidatus Limnocylindria bacterium]
MLRPIALIATLAFLLAAQPLGPSTARAATCSSTVGPGLPPPRAVRAGLAGFHADWYGQSGYMSLCPGEQATAVVAYYNSGSFGWVQGRMGESAYLGTWHEDPGQDQPSLLGGDGNRGTPATGWPRFDRVAVQPAAYVGPGQVAWFQFTVQAPAIPGTYRLGIRPVVEGARWMEDHGVFWQVTVLNADGTVPRATPFGPAGVTYAIGGGVSAQDINEVREGIARGAAHLRAVAGGDRSRAMTAQLFIGDGTQRFCCVAYPGGLTIVANNPAWTDPPAAAPDTWTARTERIELAAHEYVHVWQTELGGRGCLSSPRWIHEGMAESLAYGALVSGGLIPAANMDVFTRRQLRTATKGATLRSLEASFPADAHPYAVSYLAVDRLLGANGALPLRAFCERVGAGLAWQTAFATTFGESVDAFYARFETFRAEYVR